MSPGLTYASTATSDDSWLHSSTSSSSAGLGPGFANAGGQRTVQFIPSRPSPADERDTSLDSNEILHIHEGMNEKKAGKKLRKPRPQDGYVSDGGDGYTSENGTSAKLKAKKSTKKEKKDKGEESEGGYLSDMLARRRRNKEKEKDKKKAKAKADFETDVDGDAEETDGGYLSTGVASFVRSRKTTNAKSKSKLNGKSKTADHDTPFSPQSGPEDSDGGYLSSSSISKKRRFFRLRKGDSEDSPRPSKEVIPPVPALPKLALTPSNASTAPSRSLTPLPIAEKFASRSNTPLPGGSRTPNSSLSLDISNGYATSTRATTPVSPATTRASESSENDRHSPLNKDALATPLSSPSPSMTTLGSPGLTRAFKDAESVRSPSIDVLRAFGRQAGINMRDEELQAYLAAPGSQHLERLRGDEGSSLSSTSYGSLRAVADADSHSHTADESSTGESQTPTAGTPTADVADMPVLQLPRSKPTIKRTLSKKQTPTPTGGLGPAASMRNRLEVRSYEVLKEHIPAFDGQNMEQDVVEDKTDDERDDDVMVDVTPATPTSGRYDTGEYIVSLLYSVH